MTTFQDDTPGRSIYQSKSRLAETSPAHFTDDEKINLFR
jgi:hypothetical protein